MATASRRSASLVGMTAGRLALAAVVGALVLAAAATSALSASAVAPGAIFRVRPDLRMCPSPACGGLWVSRANQASTTCADGVVRRWCYVVGIDPASRRHLILLRADRVSGLLVRGRIVRGGIPELRSLGRLVESEAWLAATLTPWSGTVFLVSDTGVRCVRAPCFSLRISTVNTVRTATASGLDLSGVTAAPALTRKAQAALTGVGLLVAGTIRRGADGGRTVVATQFFLVTR